MISFGDVVVVVVVVVDVSHISSCPQKSSARGLETTALKESPQRRKTNASSAAGSASLVAAMTRGWTKDKLKIYPRTQLPANPAYKDMDV